MDGYVTPLSLSLWLAASLTLDGIEEEEERKEEEEEGVLGQGAQRDL
jgi:hypothetical protein